MLSLLSCGKLVNNLVEKSVKNSWKLFVQKPKLGISRLGFSHSLLKFSTFALKLVNKMNKFYTSKIEVFNPLNGSFPLFPQTSTIAITIYLNNKEGH